MKDYFKIGDVADLFRISVQTLRFYEREGLFVPEKIDRDSHYRYYSIHQLQLLQQILQKIHLELYLSPMDYVFQKKQNVL